MRNLFLVRLQDATILKSAFLVTRSIQQNDEKWDGTNALWFSFVLSGSNFNFLKKTIM